jgi:hypothetical protein
MSAPREAPDSEQASPQPAWNWGPTPAADCQALSLEGVEFEHVRLGRPEIARWNPGDCAGSCVQMSSVKNAQSDKSPCASVESLPG